MLRKTFFVILLLFLVGCASVNPYNVPEGQGAFLKNREDKKGKTKLRYFFDDVATAGGKRMLLSSFMKGADAVYKIPPGELYLGLKIEYYYKGVPESFGEALSTSFTYLYSSESRSKVEAWGKNVDIYVFNRETGSGNWEGLKINAVEGQTYQINCNIEDGKALIWIEDDNGTRVSEIVPGFSIFWGERDWLRQDVPDPVY